jgi:hypothetical protein
MIIHKTFFIYHQSILLDASKVSYVWCHEKIMMLNVFIIPIYTDCASDVYMPSTSGTENPCKMLVKTGDVWTAIAFNTNMMLEFISDRA